MDTVSNDILRAHILPRIDDRDVKGLALVLNNRVVRQEAAACDASHIFHFAGRFAARYGQLVAGEVSLAGFVKMFQGEEAGRVDGYDEKIIYHIRDPHLDRLKAVHIDVVLNMSEHARQRRFHYAHMSEVVCVRMSTPRDGLVVFKPRQAWMEVQTRPVCVLSKPSEFYIKAFVDGFNGADRKANRLRVVRGPVT